jgi:hypothetical protein
MLYVFDRQKKTLIRGFISARKKWQRFLPADIKNVILVVSRKCL